MGKGGYFNRSVRRSGGDRRTIIGVPPAAMERAMLIESLRASVRATGLTGADLEEIYDRLDATETAVLRECAAHFKNSQ
jgi:hypothetical protein